MLDLRGVLVSIAVKGDCGKVEMPRQLLTPIKQRIGGIVAATTAHANGMTAQNVGISLWQEQGARRSTSPGLKNSS